MEDRFFILVIVHQRALHQPLIEVFFEFRNFCKDFDDVYTVFLPISMTTVREIQNAKLFFYFKPKQTK
jgi:hypothetical protein